MVSTKIGSLHMYFSAYYSWGNISLAIFKIGAAESTTFDQKDQIK